MISLGLIKPVGYKLANNISVGLNEGDDKWVVRCLFDANALICVFHRHFNARMPLEDRGKQIVPVPKSATFLDSLVHRGHMLPNLLGDLGLVGLRYRFNSSLSPGNCAPNVVMVCEQIMKDFLIRSHRGPWTATPTKPGSSSAAHSPGRSWSRRRFVRRALLENHKIIVLEQLRLFAYLLKAGLNDLGLKYFLASALHGLAPSWCSFRECGESPRAQRGRRT